MLRTTKRHVKKTKYYRKGEAQPPFGGSLFVPLATDSFSHYPKLARFSCGADGSHGWLVPQPPPVLIFLFLVVFLFLCQLWCTGNLSGEIIFCYFRLACLFYLLFLKLLWSLLASSFSIQTLLFNFIWSDVLLVSCLRGAGFCLITSSPLSLHLECVHLYREAMAGKCADNRQIIWGSHKAAGFELF